MNEPTVIFPVLTRERYLTAVDAAKAQVRKRLEEPTRDQFKTAGNSPYSRQVKRNVLIALAFLTVFSFVISAGKQAAAAGLVLDGLPDKFNHLSSIWSNMSIAFMLLLGEIGSITFMVVSGIVGEVMPKTTVFGHEINIARWILQFFAVLCASYAIVSNVSITILDPIQNVALLQWLMSVGIPLLVLGLAYMLELLVVGDVKSTNEQKFRFDRAREEYQATYQHPETCEDEYKPALFDSLYSELTRTKALRDRLGEVYPQSETNLEVKRWLVGNEWSAHQAVAQFDLVAGTSNPFLLQTNESSN